MQSMLLSKKKLYTIADFTAILFHVTGVIGMVWGNTSLFASLTTLNLLLMFVLLLITQGITHWSFYVFIVCCSVLGYAAEYIGIHTSLLFGEYSYGNVLGVKYKEVPLIIGINWFIIIYCCGVAINNLLITVKRRLMPEERAAYAKWSIASLIIDGALLATFFDWVMEPVAIKLGFWKWGTGDDIPMLNYISWFVISGILLILFSICPFKKNNRFAVHLLMIQVMFFLILRTLLE
ncbi:MAG: carotenoid biosynthesis protein [Agriterribacter sp.]